MIEEIMLLSGNDIPFYSGMASIHQPTLKEIAYIGEEAFFIAYQLLNFSKDILGDEDKTNLEDTEDFNILMAIIMDENSLKQKEHCLSLLALMFPDREVHLDNDSIKLEGAENTGIIDSENYEEFREILRAMFNSKGFQKGEQEAKPVNDAAQAIADKLKAGREKLEKSKNKSVGNNKVNILSRYASILTIGLHIDLNAILNYTVFQLFDSFNRFNLYQGYDMNLKARLAGATDLDEVDNWMDDIHP